MNAALLKKLRITAGQKISVINSPKDYLQSLPQNVSIIQSLKGKYDQVHFFANNKSELEKNLTALENSLNEKAMLWVYYPKKTSKIKTDIDRDSGWKILNRSKLRSVAFISIDETWTAFGMRNEPKVEAKTIDEKEKAAQAKYVDLEKRVITPPEDLAALFNKNKKAKESFESLSFTNKKEYVLWIIEAKKDETTKTRLEQTIKKLTEGKKNLSMK